IPDKEILRGPNKVVNDYHMVKFSADTIRKMREKFHKNNFDNKVNINHDGVQVDGVTMTKSFLLDSETRKTIATEFADLPDGTWMVEYEITNEKVWQMVQDKKIN